MSQPDAIDRWLAGEGEHPAFEYYPGSKKKRRQAIPMDRDHEPTGPWDARPYIKVIKGQETEVFTIGALAQALGREIVTIRLWTRKGYIPQAPYRLPTRIVNGKEQKGRRLYTRPLIEAAIEAFDRRGLLDSKRVEWNAHSDLTLELAETWKRIHAGL